MQKLLPCLFLAAVLCISTKSTAQDDAATNIALGKSYTFSIAPNYNLCKDQDDARQLTDGEFTGPGQFWAQQSTVGWAGPSHVEIVVDLEKEEPICGASWNCAAGSSSVNWPSRINLFASNDKVHWERLGDLTLLALRHSMPPEEGYAVFRYSTMDLKARGRYFMFMVQATPYAFVDEIQVFRGPDSWLQELHPEYSATDVNELDAASVISAGAVKRMSKDLLAIEKSAGAIAEPARTRLLSAAGNLKRQLDYRHDGGEFAAILPLSALHEKILAMNSYILQDKGYFRPFLWHSNRWASLSLSAIPPSAEIPSLEVEMMRNEVRSEVINICNPTFEPVNCEISVIGLPDGANPRLCEVLVTDTFNGIPIAAALKQSEKAVLDMTVHAGCSRQVWLRFDRPSAMAGTYNATVRVSASGKSLDASLSLKIHDFTFPQRPSLHVGGWDYTHANGAYYNSTNNLKDNLAVMRDIYTDSPWANPVAMPGGAQFDDDGHLVNASELNFTEWDRWVERWDDARNYCVFWYAQSSMKQHGIGTEQFKTAVAEYMKAWSEHIEGQGKSTKQLVILLVDEPRNHQMDAVIVQWAQAIKAAGTGARIFEDPIYLAPWEGLPEMFSSVDILCPNTQNSNSEFLDFYVKQREAGKTLWLYECAGPAKLLDPVLYHRAQCWIAHEFGAEGTFYWAFGCGGGIGDSWNCYQQTSMEFSPYFVSQTSAMHSKHSEAIREGVQDFEYIRILEDRIAALRQAGRNAEADKTQVALDAAFSGAIKEMRDASGNWSGSNGHDMLDRARISILKAMEEAK